MSSLPAHLVYSIAEGMPEDEALHQLIGESLESSDQATGTLTALEALRELAQLANPHLSITVIVGPAE